MPNYQGSVNAAQIGHKVPDTVAPTGHISDPSLAPTPYEFTVVSGRARIRTQRGHHQALEDATELRCVDPLSLRRATPLLLRMPCLEEPHKIRSSSGDTEGFV